MKKNLASLRGFTLIELLVVIAIIGILSGIVLVNLRSAQEKARDSRRVADINTLVTALTLYEDNNKVYPATLAGLVSDGLINAVPVDPRSSSSTPVAYVYAALGSGTDCNGYHLSATLENTQHDLLQADSDAAAGSSNTCTGSVADFEGTDPVYDVAK